MTRSLESRPLARETYGTSKREYWRHLAEWVAAGCPNVQIRDAIAEMTVAELILCYWRHVQTHYKAETRDGAIIPTLRRLYGRTRTAEFGPLALKAFRQALSDERDDQGPRLSRGYNNKVVQWVNAHGPHARPPHRRCTPLQGHPIEYWDWKHRKSLTFKIGGLVLPSQLA
jgi:hypothetical protein